MRSEKRRVLRMNCARWPLDSELGGPLMLENTKFIKEAGRQR
jgi:hypothetical protein